MAGDKSWHLTSFPVSHAEDSSIPQTLRGHSCREKGICRSPAMKQGVVDPIDSNQITRRPK